MKFGNWTKSNMLNSVVLKLFYFERKYPFRVNLVQKFKIVSLRRNLVQRLFHMMKILFKLFNLLVVSFCLGKLVEISENILVLQSILLNFKIMLELELSLYFSLINCYLIKHI